MPTVSPSALHLCHPVASAIPLTHTHTAASKLATLKLISRTAAALFQLHFQLFLLRLLLLCFPPLFQSNFPARTAVNLCDALAIETAIEMSLNRSQLDTGHSLCPSPCLSLPLSTRTGQEQQRDKNYTCFLSNVFLLVFFSFLLCRLRRNSVTPFNRTKPNENMKITVNELRGNQVEHWMQFLGRGMGGGKTERNGSVTYRYRVNKLNCRYLANSLGEGGE